MTTTVATWLNRRIRVEQSPRGYDVIIAPPTVLPSRVATYPARYRAIEHAQQLAVGAPQDDAE